MTSVQTSSDDAPTKISQRRPRSLIISPVATSDNDASSALLQPLSLSPRSASSQRQRRGGRRRARSPRSSRPQSPMSARSFSHHSSGQSPLSSRSMSPGSAGPRPRSGQGRSGRPSAVRSKRHHHRHRRHGRHHRRHRGHHARQKHRRGHRQGHGEEREDGAVQLHLPRPVRNKRLRIIASYCPHAVCLPVLLGYLNASGDRFMSGESDDPLSIPHHRRTTQSISSAGSHRSTGSMAMAAGVLLGADSAPDVTGNGADETPSDPTPALDSTMADKLGSGFASASVSLPSLPNAPGVSASSSLHSLHRRLSSSTFRSTESGENKFFAACLMADVSGFTKLAESAVREAMRDNPTLDTNRRKKRKSRGSGGLPSGLNLEPGTPNRPPSLKSNGPAEPSTGPSRVRRLQTSGDGITSTHQWKGADKTATEINRAFSLLIDVIRSYGGDVLKFAGDALLAMWRPSENTFEARVQASLTATMAALVMTEKMDTQNEFALKLHCGLAAGSVQEVHFGGHLNRWEYLVCGSPIGDMGTAVEVADKGTIAVHESLYDIVDEYNRSRDHDVWMCSRAEIPAKVKKAVPSGTQYYIVHNVMVPIPKQHPDLVAELIHHVPDHRRPELERALYSYVPNPVVVALKAGKNKLLGDTRRVTILFIELPNFKYDTPAQLEAGQAAFISIQRAISTFDGNLRQFIQDDKGTVAIVAFGLPSAHHEDDAMRGIMTAFAIRRALAEHGMTCSIGVTTGGAWCGSVGNEIRCEYAVVGDVVNLSARLMGEAKGRILCDEVTRKNVMSLHDSHSIDFVSLPPVSLKGKKDLVANYEPVPSGTTQQWGVPDSIMVGREEEVQTLLVGLEGMCIEHKQRTERTQKRSVRLRRVVKGVSALGALISPANSKLSLAASAAAPPADAPNTDDATKKPRKPRLPRRARSADAPDPDSDTHSDSSGRDDEDEAKDVQAEEDDTHYVGALAVVTGEAGFGKTRFVQEVVHRSEPLSEQYNLRVYFGTASHMHNSVPYYAWVQIVQSLFEDLFTTFGGKEMPQSEYDYPDDYPYDRLLSGGIRPDQFSLFDVFFPKAHFAESQIKPRDRASRRNHLLSSLFSLYTKYIGPVLVVLENVQWMHSLSWEPIATLVRKNMVSSSIFIMLTTRPSKDVALKLSDWDRAGRLDLVMKPLERDAIETLMRHEVLRGDAVHSMSLPENMVDVLLDVSNGNPLHVHEVLLSLRDKLHANTDTDINALSNRARLQRFHSLIQDIPMTDTISRILTSRMDALGESARDFLKSGCVVGVEFSLELVLTLLPESWDADQGRNVLSELVRKNIVHVSGVPPHEVARFQHSTLRDVMYETIPEDERKEKHRMIAEHIESKYKSMLLDPEPSNSAPHIAQVIAHHFESSGQVLRAIFYWNVAADVDAQLHYTQESIQNLNHIIHLLRGMPEPALANVMVARWKRKLASLVIHAGLTDDDTEGVREILEEALDHLGCDGVMNLTRNEIKLRTVFEALVQAKHRIHLIGSVSDAVVQYEKARKFEEELLLQRKRALRKQRQRLHEGYDPEDRTLSLVVRRAGDNIASATLARLSSAAASLLKWQAEIFGFKSNDSKQFTFSSTEDLPTTIMMLSYRANQLSWEESEEKRRIVELLDDSHVSMVEVASLYQLMAQHALEQQQHVIGMYAALSNANTAEMSGSLPHVGVGFANLMLGCTTTAQLTLQQAYYSRSERVLRILDDPSQTPTPEIDAARRDMHFSLAQIDIGHGRWTLATHRIRAASELCEATHDSLTLKAISDCVAIMHRFRGHFRSAWEENKTLRHDAAEHNVKRHMHRGAALHAELLILTGHYSTTVRKLMEKLSISQDLLEERVRVREIELLSAMLERDSSEHEDGGLLRFFKLPWASSGSGALDRKHSLQRQLLEERNEFLQHQLTLHHEDVLRHHRRYQQRLGKHSDRSDGASSPPAQEDDTDGVIELARAKKIARFRSVPVGHLHVQRAERNLSAPVTHHMAAQHDPVLSPREERVVERIDTRRLSVEQPTYMHSLSPLMSPAVSLLPQSPGMSPAVSVSPSEARSSDDEDGLADAEQSPPKHVVGVGNVFRQRSRRAETPISQAGSSFNSGGHDELGRACTQSQPPKPPAPGEVGAGIDALRYYIPPAARKSIMARTLMELVAENVADPSVKLRINTCLAIAHWRIGRLARGVEFALHALQFFVSPRYDLLDALSNLADVLCRALLFYKMALELDIASEEHLARRYGVPLKILRRAATHAVDELSRFAEIFPIGTARHLVWQGFLRMANEPGAQFEGTDEEMAKVKAAGDHSKTEVKAAMHVLRAFETVAWNVSLSPSSSSLEDWQKALAGARAHRMLLDELMAHSLLSLCSAQSRPCLFSGLSFLRKWSRVPVYPPVHHHADPRNAGLVVGAEAWREAHSARVLELTDSMQFISDGKLEEENEVYEWPIFPTVVMEPYDKHARARQNEAMRARRREAEVKKRLVVEKPPGIEQHQSYQLNVVEEDAVAEKQVVEKVKKSAFTARKGLSPFGALVLAMKDKDKETGDDAELSSDEEHGLSIVIRAPSGGSPRLARVLRGEMEEQDEEKEEEEDEEVEDEVEEEEVAADEGYESALSLARQRSMHRGGNVTPIGAPLLRKTVSVDGSGRLGSPSPYLSRGADMFAMMGRYATLLRRQEKAKVSGSRFKQAALRVMQQNLVHKTVSAHHRTMSSPVTSAKSRLLATIDASEDETDTPRSGASFREVQPETVQQQTSQRTISSAGGSLTRFSTMSSAFGSVSNMHGSVLSPQSPPQIQRQTTITVEAPPGVQHQESMLNEDDFMHVPHPRLLLQDVMSELVSRRMTETQRRAQQPRRASIVRRQTSTGRVSSFLRLQSGVDNKWARLVNLLPRQVVLRYLLHQSIEEEKSTALPMTSHQRRQFQKQIAEDGEAMAPSSASKTVDPEAFARECLTVDEFEGAVLVIGISSFEGTEHALRGSTEHFSYLEALISRILKHAEAHDGRLLTLTEHRVVLMWESMVDAKLSIVVGQARDCARAIKQEMDAEMNTGAGEEHKLQRADSVPSTNSRPRSSTRRKSAPETPKTKPNALFALGQHFRLHYVLSAGPLRGVYSPGVQSVTRGYTVVGQALQRAIDHLPLDLVMQLPATVATDGLHKEVKQAEERVSHSEWDNVVRRQLVEHYLVSDESAIMSLEDAAVGDVNMATGSLIYYVEGARKVIEGGALLVTPRSSNNSVRLTPLSGASPTFFSSLSRSNSAQPNSPAVSRRHVQRTGSKLVAPGAGARRHRRGSLSTTDVVKLAEASGSPRPLQRSLTGSPRPTPSPVLTEASSVSSLAEDGDEMEEEEEEESWAGGVMSNSMVLARVERYRKIEFLKRQLLEFLPTLHDDSLKPTRLDPMARRASTATRPSHKRTRDCTCMEVDFSVREACASGDGGASAALVRSLDRVTRELRALCTVFPKAHILFDSHGLVLHATILVDDAVDAANMALRLVSAFQASPLECVVGIGSGLCTVSGFLDEAISNRWTVVGAALDSAKASLAVALARRDASVKAERQLSQRGSGGGAAAEDGRHTTTKLAVRTVTVLGETSLTALPERKKGRRGRRRSSVALKTKGGTAKPALASVVGPVIRINSILQRFSTKRHRRGSYSMVKAGGGGGGRRTLVHRSQVELSRWGTLNRLASMSTSLPLNGLEPELSPKEMDKDSTDNSCTIVMDATTVKRAGKYVEVNDIALSLMEGDGEAELSDGGEEAEDTDVVCSYELRCIVLEHVTSDKPQHDANAHAQSLWFMRVCGRFDELALLRDRMPVSLSDEYLQQHWNMLSTEDGPLARNAMVSPFSSDSSEESGDSEDSALSALPLSPASPSAYSVSSAEGGHNRVVRFPSDVAPGPSFFADGAGDGGDEGEDGEVAFDDEIYDSLRPRGSMVVVHGTPGKGKTALISQFCAELASDVPECLLFDTSASQVNKSTPWFIIRSIVRQMLRLDTEYEQDKHNVRHKLRQVFRLQARLSNDASYHDIERYLPLFNQLASVGFAENEHTSQLTPAQRSENTIRLFVIFVDLLLRVGRSNFPFVVIVRDGQYVDSRSWECLARLANSFSNSLVVVATAWLPGGGSDRRVRSARRGQRQRREQREQQREQRFNFLRLLDNSNVDYQVMELENLSRLETKSMIMNYFGVVEVDARLVDLVFRETEGSPQHIDKMMQRLMDDGQLYDGDEVIPSPLAKGVSKKRFSAPAELGVRPPVEEGSSGGGGPGQYSMEHNIKRELDALGKGVRRLLEVASVLGQRWRLSMLVAVLSAWERERRGKRWGRMKVDTGLSVESNNAVSSPMYSPVPSPRVADVMPGSVPSPRGPRAVVVQDVDKEEEEVEQPYVPVSPVTASRYPPMYVKQQLDSLAQRRGILVRVDGPQALGGRGLPPAAQAGGSSSNDALPQAAKKKGAARRSASAVLAHSTTPEGYWDVFEFQSVMTRDVVYGHMEPSTQLALHRIVASLLKEQLALASLHHEASLKRLAAEESLQSVLVGELEVPYNEYDILYRRPNTPKVLLLPLEELADFQVPAYHWRLAGNDGVQLLYTVLAAEQARSNFSQDEAAELYLLSLQLRRALEDSPVEGEQWLVHKHPLLRVERIAFNLARCQSDMGLFSVSNEQLDVVLRSIAEKQHGTGSRLEPFKLELPAHHTLLTPELAEELMTRLAHVRQKMEATSSADLSANFVESAHAGGQHGTRGTVFEQIQRFRRLMHEDRQDERVERHAKLACEALELFAQNGLRSGSVTAGLFGALTAVELAVEFLYSELLVRTTALLALYCNCVAATGGSKWLARYSARLLKDKAIGGNMNPTSRVFVRAYIAQCMIGWGKWSQADVELQRCKEHAVAVSDTRAGVEKLSHRASSKESLMDELDVDVGLGLDESHGDDEDEEEEVDEVLDGEDVITDFGAFRERVHRDVMFNFASLHLLRGNFHTSRRSFEELVKVARFYEDVDVQASCLHFLAYLHLLHDNTEGAFALLNMAKRAVERQPGRDYRSITGHALFSLAHLRRDSEETLNVTKALSRFGQLAFSGIQAQNEPQWHGVFRYAIMGEYLCEAISRLASDVALSEEDSDGDVKKAFRAVRSLLSSVSASVESLESRSVAASDPSEDPPARLGSEQFDLVRALQATLGKMREFCLVFPFGWPIYHLFRGCLEMVRFRPTVALECWSNALFAAQKQHMQHYAALAHYLIGVHCRSQSSHRRKHLLTALGMFKASKCHYYERLAEKGLRYLSFFDLSPALQQEVCPFNALHTNLFEVFDGYVRKVRGVKHSATRTFGVGRVESVTVDEEDEEGKEEEVE